MRRSFTRHHRRGFTLVELAIVLGVIGMIVGAIWVAASKAGNAEKNNDAVMELQLVAQNVVSMMQGHQFTTATVRLNSTAALISTIPSSYVSVAGTSAINPWAGAGNFIIWENPTVKPSKVFRISFYNVSQQGCIALLLQGTACQYGQNTCPTQVGTMGNVATAPILANTISVPAGSNWQTMMSVSAATGLCAANTATKNSVEFDYSL